MDREPRFWPRCPASWPLSPILLLIPSYLPAVIFQYNACGACVPSCFSHIRLCATSWTVARQAPLSMGLSRQEYWSGLPCPPPRDLPDLGMEPTSLRSNLHWQAGSLLLRPPGKCQPRIGTCCGCLPSTSTRIKSCGTAADDLQHPRRSSGWRAEMRDLALWETGRTGLQIVRYSQEPILWAQFLHFLNLEKH